MKYLAGLLSTEAKKMNEPVTLHDLYVELNKLAGMYWIVCACKLIEKSDQTIDMSNIAEKFNQQVNSVLDTTDPLPPFDEVGGPLRLLSLAQVVELTDVQTSKKIAFYTNHVKPQIFNFLNKYVSVENCIENHLPFWFDMRGIYCLTVLISLSDSLGELSHTQRKGLLDYINRSQVILGGFGSSPGAEAHGGYTFCAVAAIRLLGGEIIKPGRLFLWLSQRLDEMNGRVGKPRDSCYIWWIGATMINIGRGDAFKARIEILKKFLNSNCFCSDTGGISKYPSIPVDQDSVHGKQNPDLFHTFLGIASLALVEGTINPLHVLPLNT